MFCSSDPGCYDLVNKTRVSTDVESGDPKLGNNKTYIKSFFSLFFISTLEFLHKKMMKKYFN